MVCPVCNSSQIVLSVDSDYANVSVPVVYECDHCMAAFSLGAVMQEA